MTETTIKRALRTRSLIYTLTAILLLVVSAGAAAPSRADLVGPNSGIRRRPGPNRVHAMRRGRPGTLAAAGEAAVQFAVAQLGKPYRYGATGPDSYDCSGLTSSAWAAAGVQIPRTSDEQVASLHEVPMTDVRPGDILWRPGHVGLYTGNGQAIHAPQTGDVVRYTDAASFQKAVRP